MKKALLFSSALVLLAACGGSNETSGQMKMEYAEADFAPAGMVHAPEPMMARKMAAPAPPPAPNSDGATPSTGPMLAYTHHRSITSPAKDVGKVVNSHAELCAKAGFEKCMVVNSSQNDLDGDSANANLHIRATPDWIDKFFKDLPKELKSTGSKITSSNTSAQDLSTQIVDTDARLKAKLTLRDRLQALLTDRPSELGDLIDLERELSRVQSDIDANASVLAALRQRVAMSNLHMNYSAKQTVHSESVWSPLINAFKGFFNNLASALGGVISLLPYLLIWVPIIGATAWYGRLIFRKIWPKKPEETHITKEESSTKKTDTPVDAE